ncbi:DMT family transporter [Pigmentiphaga litoralis]|uniref:DMT family transporter n=1 Tax=Pigmentiphaga litoralis TaxID=516702 RepID=UPI003B4396B6
MDRTTGAWVNGLIGVVIFAGSLPATRVAVTAFDPLFLTSARAMIAAALGGLLLIVLRQRRPALKDLAPLAVVALGCVLGFPLLTALALQHVSSAHSIVFIGLLPICTALFAVLRGGERPRAPFWAFSLAGSACVVGFAVSGTLPATGNGNAVWGGLLMLAAIVVCGMGYAEGARLSRRLGGWQVISWALVLSLPVMVLVALWTLPPSFDHVTAPAWWCLGYVSVFSMLIGFIFWYRGLALGGIAGIGQLQLLQPFFGLTLAALLLHEAVSGMMLVVTLCAVGCVAGARRFAA